MSLKTDRIQKVLATSGMASRRVIETWIVAGRIKVNGSVAVLGDRVSADDKIEIDGKPLSQSKTALKTRVLCYNKPLGEVCTRSDEKDRETVFNHLPPIGNARWIMVGRLDLNTSGLLLFTNDGELAHQLMHPSQQIRREYAVRVMGEMTEEILSKLRQGVILEDGMAAFSEITKQDSSKQNPAGINQWYRVCLREGRYREVRRLFESQGLRVSRLLRTAFGPIRLPRDLLQGQYRELNAKEIQTLQDSCTNSVRR
ncbi:MAG: pseudouridine synthase [Gammaproteobacteria bacterium]|jgi:23S rRNA pseudouridine2605 synthase|nr:pseudouridine synthase [Gammaproteobacteria bacterium]